MEKKICIFVLLCSLICLSGCSLIVEEKSQPTEEQLQCEHEWVELAWHSKLCSNGDGVSFDIYCPKCKLESEVSYTDWNRIQADMNYNKQFEEEKNAN